MRKHFKYALAITGLLFICSTVALADPFPYANSPTTPQPFTVTCDAYTAPFVDGVNYMPTNNGSCIFTIPQVKTYKAVAIYKGTVGNSVIVNFGFTISNPASTLNDTGYNYSNAQLGDDYFAVAFSADNFSDILSTDSFLRTGAGTPTPDMTVVAWKWGVTPPVSISVPLPGATYDQSVAVLPLANIANLASYASVVYLLNGTPIDPSKPLPLSTLPLGPATFVIAATDGLGNTFYGTSTFMVADLTPPTIVINKPQDGHTYLQNDVSSVDATVTDNVAVATTTYALDGAPIDPTQMVPFATLSLGSHTFVVSAVDTSGNASAATSTFTVAPADLTPPTVTITSPTAGTAYNNTSSVYLTATVTDASPIAATSYTFNGTTIDPTQPLPLVGAPLGPATVSVTATDAYGNATTTTVNFSIKSADVTPPTITITNPVAGHTYVSTTSVYAIATIADASGVASKTFVLNGVAFDPAQPMPLTQAGSGPAKLVVTATDTFGNSSSSSVSFIVSIPPPPDTTGPTIVITSPIAGKTYKRDDSVYLTATVTDQSLIASVRYYFNGKQIDQTKPLAFNKTQLGNSTVSVVATDKFGNTSSSTLAFRIGPSDGNCVADITEAYDHKLIKSKDAFSKMFDDCHKISDREHDRDSYHDDDYSHHKDYSVDDRYAKAQKDIDDAFSDIDSKINN